MFDTDSRKIPFWKSVGLTIIGFFTLGVYVMGGWRLFELLDIFLSIIPAIIFEFVQAIMYLLTFFIWGCGMLTLNMEENYREEDAGKRAVTSAIAALIYGMGISQICHMFSGRYAIFFQVAFVLCALADLVYFVYETAKNREKLIYQSGYKDGYWHAIAPELYKDEQGQGAEKPE